MKIKVLYVMFLLAFLCGQDGVAQSAVNRRGGMNKEQRIGRQAKHIAAALALNEEKTVDFTAMYIQYLKDMQSCMRHDKSFDFVKPGKEGFNECSDEQIEKMIQLRFDRSRRILDLREKYYAEFRKILTPKQILKMYSEERMFGKKVQREFEKRKERKNKDK